MIDQPKLSQAEWALIVELLTRERDDLPVEIHHSRTAKMRDELHQRLSIIQDLLQRLSTPALA